MPRRRELKDVANAVAGSFSSRNSDIEGYWALGKLYHFAKQSGVLHLSVILMPPTLIASNGPFGSIAQQYSLMLVSQMEARHLTPSWLVSASVAIEFESNTAMPEFLGLYADCRPFECKVTLVDDLQRPHEATAAGWCWPHDPARETQSIRLQTNPVDRSSFS